jgi:hypothetical protein
MSAMVSAYFNRLFFCNLGERVCMMKRLVFVVAVACGVVASAASASASLINVDFSGSYTGQAATGASGDIWNTVSGGSSASNLSLKNSAGNATSVTMSYSAVGMYSSSSDTSMSFHGGTLDGLMSSYLYTNSSSTPIKVTLSGLAAGTYDLYLYSASNVKTRVTTFTGSTSVDTTGVSVVLGPNSASTLIQSTATVYDSTNTASTNYGVLELTVGTDGILTITSTMNSGESDLCGFQLVSVPEPKSVAMLLGGVLCLSIFTWRKRKMASAQ